VTLYSGAATDQLTANFIPASADIR